MSAEEYFEEVRNAALYDLAEQLARAGQQYMSKELTTVEYVALLRQANDMVDHLTGEE